jgi:regulator of nonsense transcripts 2
MKHAGSMPLKSSKDAGKGVTKPVVKDGSKTSGKDGNKSQQTVDPPPTPSEKEKTLETGGEPAPAGDAPIDIFQFEKQVHQNIQDKQRFRELNIVADSTRPTEDFFAKKDSSMKKNSAFVKKLKTISESQRDQIMKDFTTLNLTK